MPKFTSEYPLDGGSHDYDLKGDFVVVRGDDNFVLGTIVSLNYNDNSCCPEFTSKDGEHTSYFLWSDLAVMPESPPLCNNCFCTINVGGGCSVCHTTPTNKEFGPLSNDPLVNPKKASGAMKAPMHTLPTLAMIQMANVMAGGAYKYGFHNFRESKIDAQTYIGAINRHFLKWQDGVNFDEESGQHELAHVMSCCAILIDAHFTDSMIDNRSKTGLVEGLLKTSQETFDRFIKEQEEKDD